MVLANFALFEPLSVLQNLFDAVCCFAGGLCIGNAVLLYLHDFVFWLTAIVLVFLLLFRIVVVSGPSMNATLIHGDYLVLMNNIFYPEPKHGDIVVVSKDSYKDGEPRGRDGRNRQPAFFRRYPLPQAAWHVAQGMGEETTHRAVVLLHLEL